MTNRRKSISKNNFLSSDLFSKVVSIIKVIKIELLFAIMALILSLGQYFQNSVNVRINITNTWKNGYTSEIRNRVTRFRYIYNQWKAEVGEEEAKNSLKKIIVSRELFGESDIRNDEFIKRLVNDEINLLKRAESDKKQSDNRVKFALKKWYDSCQNEECKDKFKNSVTDKNNLSELFIDKIDHDKIINEIKISNNFKDREITQDEYVEIVLKYRNAIIECLNLLEAVKAVIQSKPLPFRLTIFYKDTLEGRYRDIIEETRIDLMDFIEIYRDFTPNRDTEAWFVLTSKESYLNDLVNVILYFGIFLAVLTTIYFIKMRMQRLGYLVQTENNK